MLQLVNSKLLLEFETGIDDKGNAIISKVTLANLRPDITAAELFEVGRVFGSLVDYPIVDILVISTSRVYDEQP